MTHVLKRCAPFWPQIIPICELI